MSIGRRKHSPAFALGGRTGEVLRQPGHQDRRRLLDVPGGGREGRGVGRTRGWAAGRPIFAPETVFSPFWHDMPWMACHALEVGQTEKHAAVGP